MLENNLALLTSTPMVVALLITALLLAIAASPVGAKKDDRGEFPGRRQGGGTHAITPPEQVEDAPSDSE